MDKQMTIDEVIREEAPNDFNARYVKAHKKISRVVTEKDMPRVMEEAHIMYNLCFTQRGPYSGGEAVAHPQIDNVDPLRFFVTKEQEVIINPVIVNHTKVPVIKQEGCLTFPYYMVIPVERYNKCEVEYELLMNDGTLSKRKENMGGQRAQIFQHEIQHLDGQNIYNQYEEEENK